MHKQKLIEFLDRPIKYAFYILAAAVAFSNSLVEITTAVIIVLWMVKKILQPDKSLPGARLSLILALFVFWNLASFINSAYMDESVRGLVKVIKHCLLFIATVDYFNSRGKIQRFLLFLAGFGFIIALNGLVQYLTGSDLIRQRTINPDDYLRRVSSSFIHSNDCGAYLVVIISILVSLFFSKLRPFKERLLVLIGILPVGWCLTATGSRGAWLGFIIALFFLAIIRSKKLLAGFLIMLILSAFFLPGAVKDRFSDFSEIKSKGGTVWERIELWSGTLNMVKVHPFLGFGVNTYTRNFPRYKPEDYPDVRYAHNSYLHMAAEIGVVGSGIFLIFLAGLIISAWRAMKRFEKGLGGDLFLGLWAGMIGFLAHCAVDTHFYSLTLSAFLFLNLGLLVCFRNLAYEEEH